MNHFDFLTMVLRADGTVTLICIHKSYIVYLEIYVVPIGHGFSFLVMEKSWKINVEKGGHSVHSAYLLRQHGWLGVRHTPVLYQNG